MRDDVIGKRVTRSVDTEEFGIVYAHYDLVGITHKPGPTDAEEDEMSAQRIRFGLNELQAIEEALSARLAGEMDIEGAKAKHYEEAYDKVTDLIAKAEGRTRVAANSYPIRRDE